MRLAAFLIPLALALVPAASSAREITPAEERERPYDDKFPLCHDPRVLETITARFAEKEHKFWSSSLTILAYDRIKPVAWKPWGLDFIPRRYCTATVTTSDGKRRRIDYSVREDLDLFIIAQTWGVEWCVSGLDRNLGFAPHCRMARP